MIPTTTESPEQAKARGAFYTPPELTQFLARWVIREPTDIVLEPSCGDGAFVAAASTRYRSLGVEDLAGVFVGVERDVEEAAKARLAVPSARILTSDFFDVEPREVGAVDAILGNPPYIRYHGFFGDDRAKGLARSNAMGVSLTRLASSWAPFVVHATAFLRPGGRLALVLPAELLHADYARPVRDLLIKRFGSVMVVAFDRPVFGDAQVDAVLLLASDDDDRGLRVLRLPDEKPLDVLEVSDYVHLAVGDATSRWSRNLDFDAGETYTALEAARSAIRLGSIASVDIGFVSGANDFFVMTSADAAARGIPNAFLSPAVRRPGDIPGLRASSGDIRQLLDLGRRPGPFPEPLEAYLRLGESEGISDRYKCRTRQPWYAVPLPRRKADAFLPYMNHRGPRLIVNDASALSTNLVHGVALAEHAPPVAALAVCMASSISLLSAEVEGRSYGGGVLKLETKEAERLLVPRLDDRTTSAALGMFDEIDALVRTGEIERAAQRVDESLDLDHERFWRAYMAYRQRRLGRSGRLDRPPRSRRV